MVVARASVLRCHLHRTSARLLEPLLAERHVVGPRYFLRVHRHATTHSEQCRRAWTSAPDPPCQEACPAPAVRPSSAWPARTSFAHDTGAPLVHAQPARPPCSRGRRRPRTDPLLEACVRRQQGCVLDAAPAPRVSSCPVAMLHTTNVSTPPRLHTPWATTKAYHEAIKRVWNRAAGLRVAGRNVQVGAHDAMFHGPLIGVSTRLVRSTGHVGGGGRVRSRGCPTTGLQVGCHSQGVGQGPQ